MPPTAKRVRRWPEARPHLRAASAHFEAPATRLYDEQVRKAQSSRQGAPHPHPLPTKGEGRRKPSTVPPPSTPPAPVSTRDGTANHQASSPLTPIAVPRLPPPLWGRAGVGGHAVKPGFQRLERAAYASTTSAVQVPGLICGAFVECASLSASPPTHLASRPAPPSPLVGEGWGGGAPRPKASIHA